MSDITSAYLDHDRVGGDGLLGLVDPPLDDVAEGGPAGRAPAHVQRRHEGGRRDGGGPGSTQFKLIIALISSYINRVYQHKPVDDGLFHVALDGLQHGGVGDRAEGADGARTVHVLLA